MKGSGNNRTELGLPPCSAPPNSASLQDPCSRSTPPTRLQGLHHLLTFKATLTSYVVGSTAVGYYMAPGPCSSSTLAFLCGGTALTVLSANAWNQIIERLCLFLLASSSSHPFGGRWKDNGAHSALKPGKSDALMYRTSHRYMASGGCVWTSVTFATLSAISGVWCLWSKVNPFVSFCDGCETSTESHF